MRSDLKYSQRISIQEFTAIGEQRRNGVARPIGFSAFLKLLELSDARRKTELRKKLTGGSGFQYWRPVQIVAPKAILPAADIRALSREIESLCSGHQQRHNKNAFSAFCKWTAGKVIRPTSRLPVIDAPFGNSGLVIRLKPDVSFILNEAPFSMYIWATTKPLLSAQALSIGLLFSTNAYKAKKHESYNHVIFDTTNNRLFREQDVLPFASRLLQEKVDAFKADWHELCSMTPAPHPQPIHQLGTRK